MTNYMSKEGGLASSRCCHLTRRDFLLTTAGSLLLSCAPASGPPRSATATPNPTPTSADCAITVNMDDYVHSMAALVMDSIPQTAEAVGCQAVVQPISGDYRQNLAMQLASGSVADLYIVGSLYPQSLINALSPVTDLVEEFIGRYGELNPTCVREIYVGGEAYAVPFIAWGEGGWARYDMFEDVGIDVSLIRTYEDLRLACLAVSDSIAAAGWGMNFQGYDGSYLTARVLHGFGARWAGEDGMEVTIDSPEAVQAVEWLKDTYTNPEYEKIFPPTLQLQAFDNVEAFLHDEIAYTQNPSYLYQQLRTARPDLAEVTIFHPPAGGPLNQNFQGLNNAYCFILRDASNPTVASDFIVRLFQDELFDNLFREAAPMILPAYLKMWDFSSITEDPIMIAQQPVALDPAGWNGLAWPAPSTPLMAEIIRRQIHTQMVSTVIIDGQEPSEAVQWAARESEQILAQITR